MLHYFRYYIVMLAVLPTLFFIPKFFEIHAVSKTAMVPVGINCSGTEIPHAVLTILHQNNAASDEEELVTPTPNILSNITHPRAVCNHIFRLYANDIIAGGTNQTLSTSYNGSAVDVTTNGTSLVSFKIPEQISMDDAVYGLNMHYDINMNVLTIMRKHVFTVLDPTKMRKNHLYYKIYNVGLVTLFTQVIPLVILMYFNNFLCQTNSQLVKARCI